MRETEFLSRYAVYILIGLAAILAAAFTLRPLDFAAEACQLENFTCERPSLSASQQVFTFRLKNPGTGVILQSVEAKDDEGKVTCSKAFDDGWGPFVSGRHVDSQSVISLDCQGLMRQKDLHLIFNIQWFYDTESETSSFHSNGSVVAEVGP